VWSRFLKVWKISPYCRRSDLNLVCKSIKKMIFDSLLDSCETITNESLKNCSEFFKNRDSLKDVSLGFPWCEKISNEGVKHLSQGLTSLTGLCSLNLTLPAANHITDEGVRILCESLENLTSLSNINLRFKDTLGKGITPKGLEFLSKSLRILVNLQRIRLYFQWCNAINEKDREKIRNGLKICLQNVKLDIRGC